MMRRFLLVSLAILFMSVLIFGSCAESAPAPAPASSPEPSPAPAPAPAKPIQLKLSTFTPPMAWFMKDVIAPWTKDLEEYSNGQIKTTIFPAQSLGALKDQYKMLLAKTADICHVDVGGIPGVLPLSEGIAMPLTFKTSEAACATWWELSEKYLMDTEFKRVKVLWHQCIPPNHVQMVNKPVKTLEDLKGMKFALTQQTQIAAMEQLGAVGVFVPITETYTALERGLVDGTVNSWSALYDFKSFEVTKYRTAVSLCATPTTLLMNLEVFNSLPPEIQKFINETTGFEKSRDFGAKFDVISQEQLTDIIIPHDREKGNPEIYYLPEAEIARWREALAPVYEEWIAEREAKGLPARAFYDDLMQMAAKYDK